VTSERNNGDGSIFEMMLKQLVTPFTTTPLVGEKRGRFYFGRDSECGI